MKTEYDAVVIGAGVAGSSMAHALAREGWGVALIEKYKFPRHKACGEFLSPESIGTLRELGLSEAVSSLQPSPITKARLHTERGLSLEIPLYGIARGVSRHALDAGLLRSAQEKGVLAFTGTVTAVNEVPNGHTVEFSSKEGTTRLHSRTVIAAWGRHPLSGYREENRKPSRRAYIGLKSHFAGSDSDPTVDLYFFQGGYVGIAPIEGDRLNVAALISPDLYPRDGTDALRRIMDSAAARIPVLRSRLEQAIEVPGTRATVYPVEIRPEPRGWNGIPCIGDAAAVIPPFCGDGMSMALRSVRLCAPLADAYLLGKCTYAEWNKAYSDQLKQQFARPLKWGSLLEDLLANPNTTSWLFRLGAILPGAAEKLIRATRLRE